MKKSKLFSTLIFICAINTNIAFAENYSQPFLDCITSAKNDNQLVLNCIEQESKKQKIRLLETYEKIIADIPEAQKAKFKNLHAQLLDYVNKNCNISSNASSTTLSNSNKCDTGELQKKTAELENILKQYVKY